MQQVHIIVAPIVGMLVIDGPEPLAWAHLAPKPQEHWHVLMDPMDSVGLALMDIIKVTGELVQTPPNAHLAKMFRGKPHVRAQRVEMGQKYTADDCKRHLDQLSKKGEPK